MDLELRANFAARFIGFRCFLFAFFVFRRFLRLFLISEFAGDVVIVDFF